MAAVSVAAVVPMVAAGAVYVRHAASGPPARHSSYARPPAPGICAASSGTALASRLSRDLLAVLHRRRSTAALAVNDRGSGLTCRFGAGWRFDSAGLVRLTILAALLHRHMAEHRYLTSEEISLTTAMITSSDQGATSALWRELGRGGVQHFLDLAGMRHTVPGPGGDWGLTQITAGDEMTLLTLLTSSNPVLDRASRQYALNLMGDVIGPQRWGVPAGAPAGVEVGVQDGWMPRRPGDWRVLSAGTFAGRAGGYQIVVLTAGNSSMSYGVTTIEDAAEVIHRDLSPGAPAAVPRSVIRPSQQVPDETLPPVPPSP